jgi:hypothetical protein
MTMRRLAIPALLLCAWSTFAAPVGAITLGWTITGGPSNATAYQSTTYTFTATNVLYLNTIGCVEIQLPPSYVIDSLGTPSMSQGLPWSSTTYSGNWVLVYANGGGARLDLLESVTFTVTATATQPGSYAWNTHAHRQHDCTGPELEPGTWSASVSPVQPTPTPAPTPPPPPLPSVPLPIPTLPVLPLNTPPPNPSATPRPSPTPGASSPATGAPRPTPEVVAAVPAPPPAGPTSGQPAARIAPLTDSDTGGVSVGTEVLALLDGPLVWFVPGAVVGGPGLLILLFIALQAAGAMAWIPAVRRMSGDPVPLGRRRRPGT